RKRLGETTQPRVGVVWSGSAGHGNDRHRSIALEAIGELFDLPVEWVSLQKEIRDGDRKVLPRVPRLREFSDEIADFADTAAIIACCDLVISVDTAVAHLAGAMAKQVWILLPRVPDWRWMVDREDTLWYPTARLFRQARAGDWDEVFTRVAAELARLVANGGEGPIPEQPDRHKADGAVHAPVSFGELIDKITI